MFYNNIKAILEYTQEPFNKDTFFIALKQKYHNYDKDYTKHIRLFLDGLVLSAQYREIRAKDFIKLYH